MSGYRPSARWSYIILLFLLSACGGGSGGGSGGGVSVPDPPPAKKNYNILLIMADDLGFNDVAVFTGNTAVDTPNLDELAAEGVRFTRHYADSVCSPARAALLSGLYSARTGFVPNGRGLTPEIITLPEALESRGYSTWHIGKWHVGDELPAAWPGAQGFEHWFGYLNQWLLAGDYRDPNVVKSGPRYNNPWLVEDGAEGRYYEGHLEDILTEKAKNAMESLAAGDKPWFLNIWFNAPHEPMQPAPQFAERYDDSSAGKYRALVNQLDYNVGELLQLLDQVGQRDNTIVVFLSDNGGTNRYMDNNYPFYGEKTTYYEGGVRTPLIIRWPDGRAAGSVYDGALAIYDLYPTLMAAAGLPVPAGLDGVNMLPDIDRGTSPARDLFWSNLLGFSVRTGDGKWLLTKDTEGVGNDPLYLADLENEPSGAVDVSESNPSETDRLSGLYQQWIKEIHRIPLVRELDGSGYGTLTGWDFLRTPGYGDFTFAIGVEQGFEGNLANQEGIWSLRWEPDGTVIADFQGIRLSGAPDASRDCHSVIVSGNFTPRIPGIPKVSDTLALNLYIDGQLAEAYDGGGKLDAGNFAAPTVIGEPGIQSGLRLYEPILLNVIVERSYQWPVSVIDRQVCDPG